MNHENCVSDRRKQGNRSVYCKGIRVKWISRSIKSLATRPEEEYPESTEILRKAGVDYFWFSGDISNSGR